MAHSVSTPAASERLQTLRRGRTGSFNFQLSGVVVPTPEFQTQSANGADHDQDPYGSAMVWSEAIHVMLVTHAKWRTFTQRPFPPAGSCGMMLSLALESRAAVDAMNEAAAAHGGQADVNPMEDHGFMYTRDLADPDGHMWAALWMDPATMPAVGN